MARARRQILSFAVTALSLLGCAAQRPVAQAPTESRELSMLRAEIAQLRRENEQLKNRVDAIAERLEGQASAAPRGEPPRPTAAKSGDPVVPRDLQVVKIEPPRSRTPRYHALPPPGRSPPPVNVDIPVREPDTGQVAALGTDTDLAAQAETELRAARAISGLSSARELQAFASRYPRHPQSDNALLEASIAFAAAGQRDTACAVVKRCVEEYPAGDVMPDALERLGECEAERGDAPAAQRYFQRVLTDFPGSSAAKRAEERIASLVSPRSRSAGGDQQGAAP